MLSGGYEIVSSGAQALPSTAVRTLKRTVAPGTAAGVTEVPLTTE